MNKKYRNKEAEFIDKFETFNLIEARLEDSERYLNINFFGYLLSLAFISSLRLFVICLAYFSASTYVRGDSVGNILSGLFVIYCFVESIFLFSRILMIRSEF